MSKHETTMIERYWERVGGTLIEEFQLVSGDADSGPRRADAVIVLGQKRDRLRAGQRADFPIEGKDVVVIQAKHERLSLTLMGQGVFSGELIKRFKPRSAKSVMLCTKDDAMLRPLLAPFANVEVVIDDAGIE